MSADSKWFNKGAEAAAAAHETKAIESAHERATRLGIVEVPQQFISEIDAKQSANDFIYELTKLQKLPVSRTALQIVLHGGTTGWTYVLWYDDSIAATAIITQDAFKRYLVIRHVVPLRLERVHSRAGL